MDEEEKYYKTFNVEKGMDKLNNKKNKKEKNGQARTREEGIIPVKEKRAGKGGCCRKKKQGSTTKSRKI